MTCGEGNQFRTRDVAQPAVNGGSSCLGKKYSIGGKVRPDLTSVLTDLPCLVCPRLLSPGLSVVRLDLAALLLLLWWRPQTGSPGPGLSGPVWGAAL